MSDVDGDPDVDVHELGLHGQEEGVARRQLTRWTAALYKENVKFQNRRTLYNYTGTDKNVEREFIERSIPDLGTYPQ